jgi:hypothetical protein
LCLASSLREHRAIAGVARLAARVTGSADGAGPAGLPRKPSGKILKREPAAL